MIKIGRRAQNAIAIVGYLTECSKDEITGRGTVSSGAVANALGLSNAITAKILSGLSQADIIKGATGPGGGYKLARCPEDITFIEVVSCFETWEGKSRFSSAPLAEKFIFLEDVIKQFLADNDFSTFAAA